MIVLKKFLAGLIVGLIIATGSSAVANVGLNPIKLIVNGVDITEKAAPIIVESRTLVPARALAEQLGARVNWDGEERIVYVDSVDVVRDAEKDVIENTKNDVVEIDENEWISIRDLYGSKIENYPKAFDYQTQIFNEIKNITKDTKEIMANGNIIRVLILQERSTYLKISDLDFMK